jgi:hypothetical protein
MKSARLLTMPKLLLLFGAALLVGLFLGVRLEAWRLGVPTGTGDWINPVGVSVAMLLVWVNVWRHAPAPKE